MNIEMNVTRKASPHLKPLSLAEQAKQQRFWNERLKDPLACIPREEKETGLVTPTEARKANVLFGKFGNGYVKRVVRRLTGDSDRERRLKYKMEIIGVGYGRRGYGAKWLPQATNAGFRTRWIDVSSAAWIWATTDLEYQFHNIQPAPDEHQKPLVHIREIQTLLARPDEADLDLMTVEIWYLCRLLNCLSTRSAKIVLQEIGRTTLGVRPNTSKRGAVIIINALSDENPQTDTCGGGDEH